MRTKLSVICSFVFCLLLTFTISTHAFVKGIYITSNTLEDTKRITYLINRAKAVGINTFVIDYDWANKPSKNYVDNLELVKKAGIHFVARVVIFPGGATPAQMASMEYRHKRMNQIKQAIALGAEEIQIDYIRFSSKHTKPSPDNVHKVNEVVKWYKQQIAAYKIPMQMDVFGITSFHEEFRIGQYPQVFAENVDALCPMVYPSHYEPYKQYSAAPYKTVHDSLLSLKEQLKDKKPVRIIAFIEASNYRYPLSKAQKFHYVGEEVRGAEDAGIHGWYFWSANNIYDHVFKMLESRHASGKSAKTAENNKPAKPTINNKPASVPS